jgi:hypothetical protein
MLTSRERKKRKLRGKNGVIVDENGFNFDLRAHVDNEA